MRFYLDEDLSPTIAEIARGRCSLDVISAHGVGARGWDDHAQLRRAAEDGRCVVTANRADFVALTLAAFEASLAHAGVLIVPSTNRGDRFVGIAIALCAYAERFPGGLRPYTIDFLTLA